MRTLALALLIAAPQLAAAQLAAAQDRPVTEPTRDVDVTYRANVGGKPVEQRTRTLAGAAEIRIDTPSPGLWIVLNRAANSMDMVSDADRGVVQLPYDPARVAGPADAASFRRLGDDTVAGLRCTEWATTDTSGHPVAACFTADGVLLRARAGATVLVEAARVNYGKLDPALFAIPAGYDRTAAPPRPNARPAPQP